MLQLKHTCFHISPKFPRVTAKRDVVFYEVELYTEGEGYSVINGKKYAHKHGNVLIAVPGDTRYSIGAFSCHSFKFLPNGDTEFANAVKSLHGVHTLQCYDELIPLFKEIYGLSVKEKSEIYLDAAMRNIVSLVYGNFSVENKANKNYDVSMQNALLYISENLNKKISLTEIAASVCMSPSYFHKKFKKHFGGMSPNDYILKKRIEYAKGLICDNSLSMERISELSGFSTRAYFDICFKKETGMTPAFFRQQLNQGMF